MVYILCKGQALAGVLCIAYHYQGLFPIHVYFSYWWMLLYFITGIAQPVLAIMVFAKSEGNYKNFVRFVNGVLIFETISMAYQQGVQRYIKDFEIG